MALCSAVWAKTAPKPAADQADPAEANKKHDQELDATLARQRDSAEAQAKLRSEIEALGQDRRKFNAQLIDTASRVRDVEANISADQIRLDGLNEQEHALQKSLEQRRAVIVVFDSAGENIDSPGLAALLQKCREENRTALCFVIGGAHGITQSLRGRAWRVLAFGAATWPHQLVRIMLLEQIYRAGTILARHPYHRG